MYGRKLVLVDTDRHTREFYRSKGIQLGDSIAFEPEPGVISEAPVPSPSLDTFAVGDEDDDIVARSTSLVPSPFRKTCGEDIMFRYTAEMK